MSSDTSSLVLVMKRFSRHVEALERLYKKNESFQSLCDDYQECLALHESCTRSIAQEAAAYQEDAAILLHELEEEILEYLQAEGELIDYPTQKTEFRAMAGRVVNSEACIYGFQPQAVAG